MTMHALLQFRGATRADLSEIVRLLADDVRGEQRERYEHPLPLPYVRAFEAIEALSHIELIVAELDGRLVGVLQLTRIPTLSYQGSWRAVIEGVRVDAALRGQGIGQALMEHAILRAREHGCRMVQLSTNKSRRDAQRFYERLGFRATQEGMKLDLASPHAIEPPGKE